MLRKWKIAVIEKSLCIVKTRMNCGEKRRCRKEIGKKVSRKEKRVEEKGCGKKKRKGKVSEYKGKVWKVSKYPNRWNSWKKTWM